MVKQKSYNFTTLIVLMISKTHKGVQKLCGRQLNTKVCGIKTAIFLLSCSDHFVKQRD